MCTSKATDERTVSKSGISFPTNMKTIARCFSSVSRRFSKAGFSSLHASRINRLTRLRSTARLNFFLLTLTMAWMATGSGNGVSMKRPMMGGALIFAPFAKTRSESFLDFSRWLRGKEKEPVSDKGALFALNVMLNGHSHGRSFRRGCRNVHTKVGFSSSFCSSRPKCGNPSFSLLRIGEVLE